MQGSQKDRRSRNVVLGALILLFVLYYVKLTFPQQTIQSALTEQNSASTVQEAIPQPDAGGGKGNIPRPNVASKEAVGAPKPTPTKKLESITTPTLTLSPELSPSLEGAGSATITDKVAVIIETRPRKNLAPLILHFSAVLGPSWPIVIYTSSENVGVFSTSAALNRHIKKGNISIRILPLSTLFTNSDSVSSFMTKAWLWEQLAPAEHVLFFQTDSILCANAARSVEEFFEYDFVGAPIRGDLGIGMNGGLSLRKRETMLRIVEEWDWEENRGSRFEDQWFYDRLMDIKTREDESDESNEGYPPIKLPTMEVARTFSVETIDFPHPLGLHQAHRWIPERDQMFDIDEWCPEYKLCSGEFIKDDG